jgi:ankyrin repeat protein
MKVLFGVGQSHRETQRPLRQTDLTQQQGLALLAELASLCEDIPVEDTCTFDRSQVPPQTGLNAQGKQVSFRSLNSAFSVWQRPQASLVSLRVNEIEVKNQARYNERMPETLLYSALSQPRPEVKRLLERPDIRPEWIQRALTNALEQAGNGFDQRMNGAVSLLLDSSKVDVNLTDGKGAPLILKAIQAQNGPVFWELLTHPKLDRNEVLKVWDFVLARKDTDLMEWLLNHPKMKPSVINRVYTTQDSQGQPIALNLFEAALRNGHVPSAKLIAEHPKFAINTPLPGVKTTPLCLAVAEGQTELVQAILKRNDLQLEKPYHFPQSQQAVVLAAQKGHLPTLHHLFNRGLSLNAKAPDGKTALAIASSQGHTEVVKWMIPWVNDSTLVASLPLSDKNILEDMLISRTQDHAKHLKETKHFDAR